MPPLPVRAGTATPPMVPFVSRTKGEPCQEALDTAFLYWLYPGGQAASSIHRCGCTGPAHGQQRGRVRHRRDPVAYSASRCPPPDHSPAPQLRKNSSCDSGSGAQSLRLLRPVGWLQLRESTATPESACPASTTYPALEASGWLQVASGRWGLSGRQGAWAAVPLRGSVGGVLLRRRAVGPRGCVPAAASSVLQAGAWGGLLVVSRPRHWQGDRACLTRARMPGFGCCWAGFW